MGQALQKINKYSKSELKKCSDLLNHIYSNDDECFVRALSKQKHKTKVYPINSLKEPIKLNAILNALDKEDIYLNLNPFRTMDKSTRSNLFCINNIAVDIDYKKVGAFKELEPEQVIKLLEMDYFDIRIPTPNFIEYSNQIRLIYTIETCYIPKYRDNVVVLAERVAKVFADELKEFGAETQHLESYFRVPGSINSKNGAVVEVYYYDNSIRYTLKEIQELWLDELPSWYKKRTGRTKAPKKVVKLHNVYALNCNRLRDLEKIQEHLNNINVTDMRARLCFLYRNYTLIKLKYQNGELKQQDYKFAEEEMLKFNSNFKYPLRTNVIEGATRVVNSRQYLYKNDSLINFLELDYEMCEILELESLHKVKTKEERDKDYYKRNSEDINKIKKAKYQEKGKETKKIKYQEKLKSEGKMSKKEELEQLRVKIKTLLTQGFKNKDICQALQLPIKTLERHIKFIKIN